ncbi:MAG: trypsin-like peptidase domain-containing protein [Bacteroidetes bacterium]|nr:trypsin-like peptidase domain-containing protein [Bacteroidota bacterium]
MSDITDLYKDIVIQIATPYGTGTGFYLKKDNVFVTNNHVVKGSSEVIISGKSFSKMLTEVLFNDPIYDLAFLKVPDNITLAEVDLSSVPLNDGDQITAIGHPYGLKYTSTRGIVSKASRLYNDINYVQVDAAINPGNSGGPLVNGNGEIVGVNTFIIADGNNLGFSLPANYVRDAINDYKAIFGKKAFRCNSCKNILTEETLDDKYCSFCGSKIEITDFKPKPYVPSGVGIKVEEIIEKLGKNVSLSRIGPDLWEIENGSAIVKITYWQNSRFVIGDAHLCNLPKMNILEIYEYLLRENYDLEGLVFSVNNQEVLLSMLVYDEDLSLETGVEIFSKLFDKADYYDTILIDKYGAVPHLKEDF